MTAGLVSDDTAEIRMVNGAAARLTGLSTRELQTLTVWDITHTTSQMDFDVLWKEFLRAGRQRGSYALRACRIVPHGMQVGADGAQFQADA